MSIRRAVACALLLALAGPRPGRAQDYAFTTIDVPDGFDTRPSGINNRGLVSGMYQTGAPGFGGFLSRDGAIETVFFPGPGPVDTHLGKPNERGQVAGSYTAADGSEDVAVYDTRTGTWTPLPELPGAFINRADSINDSGRVAGHFFAARSNVGHGWVWGSGRYTTFDVPGANPDVFGTRVADINEAGTVVGSYVDEDFNTHGFLRRRDGTSETVDVPGSFSTVVNGINSRGDLVGAYLAFDEANGTVIRGGFVFSGGKFHTVIYPGASTTMVTGINDRGDLVGYYFLPTDPFPLAHGFVATRVGGRG
jgi:hypothetical protein